MRRLVVAAGLVIGLILPAATEGAKPKPIFFWSDVVDTIKAPGQPTMPLVVRPSTIRMFADGSWYIEHLRWTGWGSSTAHASGISNASNGIPNQAEGKRIKNPARFTLSKRGQFDGHRVYRCFRLTIPSHPTSDQHRCLKDYNGYWAFG